MVRLKDWLASGDVGVQILFQFHYGTIKRRCVACFKVRGFYFNSTMVRLKEYSAALERAMCFYFNSTMVRLKGSRTDRPAARRGFQFHYGTIKSVLHGKPTGSYRNFNSTMVRLKESFAACCIAWREFQFHYGTIKRSRRKHIIRCELIFQFHYGTIKRSTGYIIL